MGGVKIRYFHRNSRGGIIGAWNVMQSCLQTETTYFGKLQTTYFGIKWQGNPGKINLYLQYNSGIMGGKRIFQGSFY